MDNNETNSQPEQVSNNAAEGGVELTAEQKQALQENISSGTAGTSLTLLPANALTDEQKKEKAKEYKQLSGAWDKLKVVLRNSEQAIAELMLQSIEHCHKYGDTSLVQRGFTCLPKTFNVPGLRNWIERNTPIAIPALSWDMAKGGWYPDNAKANFALFGKKSPRLEKLKAAHDGQVWNIEAAQAELNQSDNAFKRLPVDRQLKPFTALVLWEAVMNVKNKIENAFDPAEGTSPRPIDETYGDKATMLKEFEEIELICEEFIEKAKARHDKAVGTRKGTRLIQRGSPEHKAVVQAESNQKSSEAA